MFNLLKGSWEDFLDLLYPEGITCYLCGERIRGNDRYGVCYNCINDFVFIKDKYCSCCGKLLETGDVCSDCRSFFHYFNRAFSLCVYDGSIKEWIYAFKYGNRAVLARPFGKMMADRIRQLGIKDLFDCIIPVPLHRKKLRQRGYNQACLLGKVLAGELNIKLLTDILIRVKDTPPLSGLTRHQRIECLENAFHLDNSFSKGIKNVLLIDDIYTTGVTVSQCAKILKDNGAERVYVFTLASGKNID